MAFDPVLLSRVQFAFTVGFHILFPTLTIGLAVYLTFLEGRWLTTANRFYLRAAQFWSRIFALTFGMGVVSGVVLSYEVGTNFGRWAEITGNVVGPLMSYEVLTAFFLEAGFLGIVLFGWNRVRPGVHFFSTCMVALGTLISAFWILAANSWMHTPAGFELIDGKFHVTSWSEAIFNPSFPYRFAHMVMASLLTTTFVVAAIAAWYLRRRRHVEFAGWTLRAALLTAALLAPAQIVIGDLHGLNSFEHQPTKVAAMEGHWETERGAPLYLFALPDQEAAENDFALALPHIGSLILAHEWNGEVGGLDRVPRDQWPYVPLVFWSFRLMVGCGLLMLALAWYGAWQTWRGTVAERPLFLRLLTWSAPLGYVALLAGWTTTEAGRQPWTVQGILRTSESVSAISGGEVAFSLVLFAAAYAAIFATFFWFLLRTIGNGPEEGPPAEALPHQGGARPAFQSS